MVINLRSGPYLRYVRLQFALVPRPGAQTIEHKPLTRIDMPISMPPKKRVAIVGSGNWGCAIAKIVGQNCARHNHLEEEVLLSSTTPTL